MIEVQLYTRSGDHVAGVLVPPFQQAPDIVVWGSRVFVRDDPTDEQETRYREGFAFYTNSVVDDYFPGSP